MSDIFRMRLSRCKAGLCGVGRHDCTIATAQCRGYQRNAKNIYLPQSKSKLEDRWAMSDPKEIPRVVSSILVSGDAGTTISTWGNGEKGPGWEQCGYLPDRTPGFLVISFMRYCWSYCSSCSEWGPGGGRWGRGGLSLPPASLATSVSAEDLCRTAALS